MAIAFGVLSALCWGIAAVAGGVLARRIGALATLGWAMLISLAAAIPLALASGAPKAIDIPLGAGTLLVAFGGLGGLALIYAGLRRGSIAVVAPVSATYGGVAALFAVIAGETLGILAAGALVVAVVGAVLAARGDTATPGLAFPHQSRAVLFAVGAALLWGIQLFIAGRIGDDIGASWVVLAMRVVGVAVVSLPLVIGRRLPVRRDAIVLGAIAGLGEVAGFTLYVIAAGDGVAIASVLSSQYAAVAALIGIVILGERLRRLQLAGVLLILVAVAVLALA